MQVMLAEKKSLAELLEDYRGRSLLVYSSYWAIDFICRRNPGLKVKEIIVEEG